MRDAVLFEHITPIMWVMFVLGLITLFSYCWRVSSNSKGVKKYMTLSMPNVLFHVIASFMVFLTLEETGEYLISKFLTDFEPGKIYHLSLSGLTGMFGSFLVALILELGSKIFK